jgi:hypothetical protein
MTENAAGLWPIKSSRASLLDGDLIGALDPRCPIENVRTMHLQDSGPAGLRWACSQCRVVVVMPRAPLRRALARRK